MLIDKAIDEDIDKEVDKEVDKSRTGSGRGCGGRGRRRRWGQCAAMLTLATSLVAGASCNSSGGGGGSGAPPVQAVVRGPQVALVGETSVTLAWTTALPSDGAVQYGVAPALDQEASSAGPMVEHVVDLAGLLPDELYQYKIVVDGTPEAATRTFKTLSLDAAAPLRIVVFGDTGQGTVAQTTIAARVLAAAPDLVLHTGDVAYDSGTASQLNSRYFTPYEDLVDHIPFYPSLGNHDVRTGNGRPFLDALVLPRNSADGTERYYSFDAGGVHMVALNSNASLSPGSPQRSWLEGDLAANTSTWTFVYFHHPPYSSSSHGSSLSVRDNLRPVFDAAKVDVVFNGHDHDYERTHVLRDDTPQDTADTTRYLDPNGTIYIVTGGGGSSLYPAGSSWFTVTSTSTHHFLQVDVAGSSLELRCVGEDGAILDTVSIDKTP